MGWFWGAVRGSAGSAHCTALAFNVRTSEGAAVGGSGILAENEDNIRTLCIIRCN